MSDAIFNDLDRELSSAHELLTRRRALLAAQRDALDEELGRVDAAINAMRAVVERSQSITADGGGPAAETMVPMDGAIGSPARGSASAGTQKSERRTSKKESSRRIRIIEVLLENAENWLTVAEIADLTEGGRPTAAQKNAISEALRRMYRQGDVERDNTNKAARYKAIPAALRERLLSDL